MFTWKCPFLIIKNTDWSNMSQGKNFQVSLTTHRREKKVWKTSKTYSSVIASWFVKPKFGKGSSVLGAWGTFKTGVVLEASSALFSSFSSAFLFPPFWKYSRHTLKKTKRKIPQKNRMLFLVITTGKTQERGLKRYKCCQLSNESGLYCDFGKSAWGKMRYAQRHTLSWLVLYFQKLGCKSQLSKEIKNSFIWIDFQSKTEVLSEHQQRVNFICHLSTTGLH